MMQNKDFDKQSKEYFSFNKTSMAAASVAMFAKGENRVLRIIRLTEPFKDRYAFLCVFLDVHNEDLYDTSKKKLKPPGIRFGE